MPEAPLAYAPSLEARRPLRVGIVGFGNIGQTRARCVADHPDLVLAHVGDIDPARQSHAAGTMFSTDYRAVVEDPAIDVVFVCAYNNIVPEIVVAALDNGKHVFCEKPPGRTIQDVERIIAAERANPGTKLQFGFNHRYHYAVMEAKTMVEAGHFGRLLWMRGVYGKSGGQDYERIWRSDPVLAGGGILIDQGIHMVDLFCHFCGDFTDIRSLVRTLYWKIAVEDNAFAILSNPQGQIALLHSSSTHWKHRFTLEMCCEEGYININGILSSTRSYGDESLTFARRPSWSRTTATGRPPEEMIFFDKDDSWLLEVKDFVKAICEDRPVTNGSSADALRAMRLVHAIYANGR